MSVPSSLGSPPVDAGLPFGELPLIDEIVCGDSNETHRFTDGPEKGVSRVETILGRPCRVLPVEGGAKYFAYRIGEGKGLRAGKAYLLSVEYPEDQPRTMVVQNRGGEQAVGVHAGQAIGDVIYTFTNNNCESLNIPLSGKMESQRMLFYLNDHLTEIFLPRGIEPDHRGNEDDVDARPLKPEDGFWVIIAQFEGRNIPLGGGAAVSRIRLFEVPDPETYFLDIQFPPEGLPRRHLFFREEMSDGAINSRRPQDRAVENQTDWFEYKARQMRFLGLNTWGKDILEFGGNPPFDTTYRGGGERWFRQTRFPTRWSEQLEMLAKYGIDVLPFTEYAGSDSKIDGLGREKRCKTLEGGDTYTHIVWSEKYNADVTDPDTLEDFKKVLDCAIIRYKDTAAFVGVWLRTRPSHLPMSFSDRCLTLFSEQANAGQPVTREQLKADTVLYEKYRQWWFLQRREFLIAIRDYLREQGVDGAEVLFTADSTEPGFPLKDSRSIVDENLDIPDGSRYVVTDDMATWEQVLSKYPDVVALDLEGVIKNKMHLDAATTPQATWGQWEWQHSVPPPDPQNYRDTEGVMMTLSFNRAYTVGSPEVLEAFRTPSGLALMRHYSLNEATIKEILGYFVTDMELPREYCMLAEVRAMANGDPRYLGYMHSNSFNRGFPEYVRNFNSAFLALPALPSVVLETASSDPEVVVRKIDAGEHGVYLSVSNISLLPKEKITITLPKAGRVTDAATGQSLPAADGKVTLDFYACQLRALRIQ